MVVLVPKVKNLVGRCGTDEDPPTVADSTAMAYLSTVEGMRFTETVVQVYPVVDETVRVVFCSGGVDDRTGGVAVEADTSDTFAVWLVVGLGVVVSQNPVTETDR